LVSFETVRLLLLTQFDIDYVYESARKTVGGNRVLVKGENFILSTIREIKETSVSLGRDEIPELAKLIEPLKKWEEKLDKEYDEFAENLLNEEDGKALRDEFQELGRILRRMFNKPSQHLLRIDALFDEAKKLEKLLEPKAQKDLRDGVACLLDEHATPAGMILNRVGEYMVRKLYKKIMKKSPPTDYTWGNMENELKSKLPQNDPILGLMQFRRINRNDALHPGLRYNLKEAEEIFLKVKELVQEINKKLKKSTKRKNKKSKKKSKN